MANQRSSIQIKAKISRVATILRQTLDAFAINKPCTTAYHPQGDSLVERFNRSLLRAYVDKLTGSSTYQWYCMHIVQHIHQQLWPILFSCLADSPNALITLSTETPIQTPIQTICTPSWQS